MRGVRCERELRPEIRYDQAVELLPPGMRLASFPKSISTG